MSLLRSKNTPTPSPVTSLSAQFETMTTASTGKKAASSPTSPMMTASYPKAAGSTSPRRKLDFAGLFDGGASPALAADGFDPDLQGCLTPISDTPSASLQSLFDAPLLPEGAAGDDSNDSISSQLSCSPSFFRQATKAAGVTPSSRGLTPSSSSTAGAGRVDSPSEFLDPNSMNIQTPRSRHRSQRLSLGSRSRLERTPPGSQSSTRCSLQFSTFEACTPDLFRPTQLKRAKSFAGGKSRRSIGGRKRPASPGTPQQVSIKRRSLSSSTKKSRCLESSMDVSMECSSPLAASSSSSSSSSCTSTSTDTPTLRWRRYHSDSSVIKNALQRAEEEADLIADFSRPYCLPLAPCKHADLKAINPKTMVDILHGKYDDVIGQCVTVDCRYPYEFSGGHIKGAVNMYTKQQILQQFFTNQQSLASTSTTSSSSKRTVIIMHCEFSSERGPKMVRFLRAHDRELNKNLYPKLNFPEVYILEGGYKAFYEFTEGSDLCSPQGYMPMLHAEHGEDLKYFRRKTKSLSSLGGRQEKRGLPLRSLSFC